MKNKELLWISYCAPYDGVAHAGGKIHNYYLKGLQNLSDFDITLVTFAYTSELDKIKTSGRKIHMVVNERVTRGYKHYLNALRNRVHQVNPFSLDGGFNHPIVYRRIKDSLAALKKSGYKPNLIILHWTQIVICIDIVKKFFEDIPVVAIEEDVAFQSLQRKRNYEKNSFKKRQATIRLKKLQKLESESLNKCELVILNNHKDQRLLNECGVSTAKWVWTPYFTDYSNVDYIGGTRNLLFYGAMDREENWRSAIWFIKNVLSLLGDCSVKFIIVGKNPPPQLCQYSSERVIIKGFVEDVAPFFRDSVCLVAPLVMGAGVKIKILEGLSAGIPILTNHIGAEGINIQDTREFFLCVSPNDYAEIIKRLLDGEIDIKRLSMNEKRFIKHNYNYSDDRKKFCSILQEILNKEKSEREISV